MAEKQDRGEFDRLVESLGNFASRMDSATARFDSAVGRFAQSFSRPGVGSPQGGLAPGFLSRLIPNAGQAGAWNSASPPPSRGPAPSSFVAPSPLPSSSGSSPSSTGSWNPLPFVPRAAASAAAPMPSMESLIKPISSTLAIPIAAGFGQALGQARGWKDLDDQLGNMAARLRQLGGFQGHVGTALAAGRLATGPLALAGLAAAGIGGLAAVGNYAFDRQAASLAPYNATMATAAMRMEIGDYRRSVELASKVETSFKELGGALSVLKDSLVDTQAFGLNAVNKVAGFGVGALNQTIRDVDKVAAPILAAAPAAIMGMVPRFVQAGQVGGMGLNILGNAAGRAMNNPLGLAAGALATLDPTGILGQLGVPGLGGFLNGQVNAAVRDPKLLGQFAANALAAKLQNDRLVRDLESLREDASKMPANLAGAGAARANWASLGAAVRGENPLKAWVEGFRQGVREEEEAVRRAEERDARAMTVWTERMFGMANHAMLNRFPLRAPNAAANAARGGAPAAPRVNGGLAGLADRLPNNARGRAAFAREEMRRGLVPRGVDPRAIQWNRRNLPHGNPFIPPEN